MHKEIKGVRKEWETERQNKKVREINFKDGFLIKLSLNILNT